MCSIDSVYHQTIETLSKGYKSDVSVWPKRSSTTLTFSSWMNPLTDWILIKNTRYVEVDQGNGRGEVHCHFDAHPRGSRSNLHKNDHVVARGKILTDSTPTDLKDDYKCSLDEVFRKITTQAGSKILIVVQGNLESTMNSFLSVFKRELKSYFTTPLAYVFLVIFLFAASFGTFKQGFLRGPPSGYVAFFHEHAAVFCVHGISDGHATLGRGA
jgi:hypothetical protein